RRLSSLKREIDKVTDYYDVIRIYQYPLEGMFALTTLKNNKWRRIIVRPPKS
ncbi:MAG: CRISPR-associated protein Cas2, partial [Treponema sp.]|nr:CRISPR-associated protein Cas2 [Treponema sp.]